MASREIPGEFKPGDLLPSIKRGTFTLFGGLSAVAAVAGIGGAYLHELVTPGAIDDLHSMLTHAMDLYAHHDTDISHYPTEVVNLFNLIHATNHQASTATEAQTQASGYPATTPDHRGTYDIWQVDDSQPHMGDWSANPIGHDLRLMHEAQQATQGSGTQPVPHDALQSQDFQTLVEIAYQANHGHVDAQAVLSSPDTTLWMASHHTQDFLAMVNYQNLTHNGQEVSLGTYIPGDPTHPEYGGHTSAIFLGSHTTKDANGQEVIIAQVLTVKNSQPAIMNVTLGVEHPSGGGNFVTLSSSELTENQGSTLVIGNLQQQVDIANQHIGEQVDVYIMGPYYPATYHPEGTSLQAAQDSLNYLNTGTLPSDGTAIHALTTQNVATILDVSATPEQSAPAFNIGFLQ